MGHNSRAVHQAYAKGVTPVCPPLDQFESEMKKRLLPFPVSQSAVLAQPTTTTKTGTLPTQAGDAMESNRALANR